MDRGHHTQTHTHIKSHKPAHPTHTHTHIDLSHHSTFFSLLPFAVLRDEFRLEPQNTRIAQGDTALLECAPPRGIPEPTVTWKKGGQKLDLEGSKRVRIVDGGNLAIQDARQSDEGQYQCIAKNPVGVRESSLATLKVHGKPVRSTLLLSYSALSLSPQINVSCSICWNVTWVLCGPLDCSLNAAKRLIIFIAVKPYIIRGPHDQTVLEGASVTFPCRVGGDPMPDVLWLRTASGGNMPLGKLQRTHTHTPRCTFIWKMIFPSYADRVSVLEDRSLRLERVTIADEGEYSCEADNVVGAITAMGTLTVFGE